MNRFFLILLFSYSISSFGAPTLVLTDNLLDQTIRLENGDYLEYCILKKEELNPSDFEKLNFKSVRKDRLRKIKKNNIYCFKFSIQNNSSNNKWIVEQFDFHIGSLTLIDSISESLIETGPGYATNFNNRTFKHKNPVFNLEISKNEIKTYYIIAKTEVTAKHEFRIRSVEHFTSYAVVEYYLLGIFYGILLIMIVYYLLVYIPLRESLYLYFALFIGSVAFYNFSHDGVGFQFFWKTTPSFNYYSYYYSPIFFLITYIAYTHKFLDFKNTHPILWKINWASLGAYTLFYAVDLIINSDNNAIYFLPLPIAIIYYSCIKSLVEGNILTKYFFLGSTLIIVGSTLFMLNSLNIIPNNIITVYGSNFGILIDILVMTIALSDRLSIIRKSKEEADLKLIEQLKETSKIKDEVNLVLEEKVALRTSQLNEKVEELDILNQRLNEQADTINKINSNLDLDNHKLKRKVEQTTQSWITKKEITFEEFKIIFPDDLSCTRYLAEAKWSTQYSCRKCGNKKSLKGNTFLARRCTKCGYNETPTSKTIFNRLKIPLQKAFYMSYKIYHSEGNIKASILANELELNQSTCKYFKDRIVQKIPYNPTMSGDDFWKKLIHVF